MHTNGSLSQWIDGDDDNDGDDDYGDGDGDELL